MKMGLKEAVSFFSPSRLTMTSLLMPSIRSRATWSDAAAQMSTILL